MIDQAVLEWLRSEEHEAFTGWDFSHVKGRMLQEPLPWDYDWVIRRALQESLALLDMGTGGGERLASFSPLPSHTCATEAYLPNVPVARQRLEPLGVRVIQVDDSGILPFEAESFDLVINRQSPFDAGEVGRVLKPGGQFITQQVGSRNLLDLNEVLGAPQPEQAEWTLAVGRERLERQCLLIEDAQEALPIASFLDVGALVFYLKAVSWQITDFSVDGYQAQLGQLHHRVSPARPLKVHAHRFFLRATKLP